MKVICPDCEAVIPAEDISLETGWAKCAQCHEVFRLERLIEGYSSRPAQQAGSEAEAVPERPFDAWAIVEHDGPHLLIHLPPRGMRAGTWGLMFFGLFWTGFVCVWTLGALGLFFNQGQIHWANLAFASFSIPFWLIGFGMLGSVIWMARGSRSVFFDGLQMLIEYRCLFWRRVRAVDLIDVQRARPAVGHFRTEGQPPEPHVEIVYQKGSVKLPCSSEDEQRWLIAEINGYLRPFARGE